MRLLRDLNGGREKGEMGKREIGREHPHSPTRFAAVVLGFVPTLKHVVPNSL